MQNDKKLKIILLYYWLRGAKKIICAVIHGARFEKYIIKN